MTVIIIASAKRALLTNVYVYRKSRTEAKAIRQTTHTVSQKSVVTPKRNRKYHGASSWATVMEGQCDLKLAKMYVIEKCCNGYRPRSCDCDAALIVTPCGDEQSNNAITITTTLKSV